MQPRSQEGLRFCLSQRLGERDLSLAHSLFRTSQGSDNCEHPIDIEITNSAFKLQSELKATFLTPPTLNQRKKEKMSNGDHDPFFDDFKKTTNLEAQINYGSLTNHILEAFQALARYLLVLMTAEIDHFGPMLQKGSTQMLSYEERIEKHRVFHLTPLGKRPDQVNRLQIHCGILR